MHVVRCILVREGTVADACESHRSGQQIRHIWLSRAVAAMRYLLVTFIRKLPQHLRELRPRQQVA